MASKKSRMKLTIRQNDVLDALKKAPKQNRWSSTKEIKNFLDDKYPYTVRRTLKNLIKYNWVEYDESNDMWKFKR